MKDIKIGDLITVTYKNGVKRSGVVTDKTNQALSFEYFDEIIQGKTEVNVTFEDVAKGLVTVTVSNHLGEDKTASSQSTSPFDEMKKLLEQGKKDGSSDPFGDIFGMFGQGNKKSTPKVEDLLGQLLNSGKKNPPNLNDLMQTFLGGNQGKSTGDNKLNDLLKSLQKDGKLDDLLKSFGQPQKSQEKQEEKVIGGFSQAPKSSIPFFEQLKYMNDMERLVTIFKDEDVQTLAVIAYHLNPASRTEFLYRLPDQLFINVNSNIEGVSSIGQDILNLLEKQLETKYNAFSSSTKQEKREEKQSNPFDSFGGGMGKGLGGLGGLLGGLGLGGLSALNLEDILKEVIQQQVNQTGSDMPTPEQLKEMMESATENLPQMMEQLMENLPQMMEDMMRSLRNEDEDDDQDNF